MADLPPPPRYPPPPPPPPSGLGPTWHPSPAPAPSRGPSRADLASFGQRLGAYLIDGVILSITMLATALLCVLVIALGPSHTTTCESFRYSEELGEQTVTAPCTVPDATTVALAAIIGLAGLAATIVVYVHYFRRLGRTGQSWGRQAMDIRVLDITTGLPIGGGRAFGRFLLSAYLSSAICYLGFLWMLWDDRGQTWHDKIMNTVVVRA